MLGNVGSGDGRLMDAYGCILGTGRLGDRPNGYRLNLRVSIITGAARLCGQAVHGRYCR